MAYYILTAALLILGLSIGFFAGRTFDSPTVINDSLNDEEVAEAPGDKTNLYASQTATIRGLITAVNGKTLTVKSLIDDSTTGNITLSDNVIITKPGSTTPSTNLSSIEQNKEVLITLEMFEGNYKVISLQYPVPAPSLAPIPETSTPAASTQTR